MSGSQTVLGLAGKVDKSSNNLTGKRNLEGETNK
jgi:hypothetical protein